jgi:hypothetical protein
MDREAAFHAFGLADSARYLVHALLKMQGMSDSIRCELRSAEASLLCVTQRLRCPCCGAWTPQHLLPDGE